MGSVHFRLYPDSVENTHTTRNKENHCFCFRFSSTLYLGARNFTKHLNPNLGYGLWTLNFLGYLNFDTTITLLDGFFLSQFGKIYFKRVTKNFGILNLLGTPQSVKQTKKGKMFPCVMLSLAHTLIHTHTHTHCPPPSLHHNLSHFSISCNERRAHYFYYATQIGWWIVISVH